MLGTMGGEYGYIRARTLRRLAYGSRDSHIEARYSRRSITEVALENRKVYLR
jgi:hypothetical protein